MQVIITKLRSLQPSVCSVGLIISCKSYPGFCKVNEMLKLILKIMPNQFFNKLESRLHILSMFVFGLLFELGTCILNIN